MITEEQARQMRARIMQVGLDFRDVYQSVGIERETDATYAEVGDVYALIQAADASCAEDFYIAAYKSVLFEIKASYENSSISNAQVQDRTYSLVCDALDDPLALMRRLAQQ